MPAERSMSKAITSTVRIIFLCLLSVACHSSHLSAVAAEPASPAFPIRGYYITLMRMPVMGLAEWKQAVDCLAEDDINTLILWTAGGFRSNKFPITWAYNSDHANIEQDFVRELIDYAHTKRIRVLLGFTPFGYDGVNRYPLEHPELKAKKADGSPVDEFGIHSRGWNLCPAQAESQRFMREYIREMVFDFYPNADGLLIESSDYAICHCPDCGPRFYDHEFAVRPCALRRSLGEEPERLDRRLSALLYGCRRCRATWGPWRQRSRSIRGGGSSSAPTAPTSIRR